MPKICSLYYADFTGVDKIHIHKRKTKTSLQLLHFKIGHFIFVPLEYLLNRLWFATELPHKTCKSFVYVSGSVIS